ncbi:MAG: hypothetical protein PHD81_01770 [Candidatus Nanoarchaeia archaeon]|nr:hypothetical protein [Candidatus Nanoarchaeia archaeon]MDD5587817.1 hypothetical protein [Candidatus Nanoarchaeia archaeon]
MNYSKKIKLATAAFWVSFGISLVGGGMTTYSTSQLLQISKPSKELSIVIQKEKEFNAVLNGIKSDNSEYLEKRVVQLNKELRTEKSSPIYQEQLNDYNHQWKNQYGGIVGFTLGFAMTLISFAYNEKLKFSKGYEKWKESK